MLLSVSKSFEYKTHSFVQLCNQKSFANYIPLQWLKLSDIAGGTNALPWEQVSTRVLKWLVTLGFTNMHGV